MTLITDPNFSTWGAPQSKWSITCHKGVVITPTREDDTLRLAIANTSGANWHGELMFAPFAVAEGEGYRLSFFARAQTPFLFSVWLGQAGAPYASLVAADNHFGEKQMSSEWQRFTHTWVAARTEPQARLDFVLGRIDTVVELRSAELTTGKSGA